MVKESEKRTVRAFISMGSNLGDRERNLKEAVLRLQGARATIVRRVSSVYETAPLDVEGHGTYLNAVAEVETTLSPLELLYLLESIERELGRVGKGEFTPRTIDLDLLLFDDLVMKTERLTLPHPKLWERGFVLVPLAELEPDLEASQWGKVGKVRLRAQALAQQQSVRLWGKMVNVCRTSVESAEEPSEVMRGG